MATTSTEHITADALIAEFEDQAYWEAVQRATVGVALGDDAGAEAYAKAAQELLQRGYHKRGFKVR